MNKFRAGFSTFMLTILKVLLGIIVITSAVTALLIVRELNISILVLLGIYALVAFISYKVFKSNLSHKKKIVIFILIAIAMRALWLINIDSEPSSDFLLIYQSAHDVAKGDLYAFKGTAYIARFPHLTVTTLYMAALVKWFASPIIAMKVLNFIYGIICVILIYLISKEVFNKKYSEYATIIAAVFPGFIAYTGVFCSENIAMPFYLLSIYLFVKAIKGNKLIFFALTGAAISIGNLFRMVGIIMMIAYVMYVLIFTDEKVLRKLRNAVLLVVPYWLILVSVSGLLQSLNVTEYPLWRGAEPSITSVLKGTHYASGGHWNEEDVALIESCNDDYDKIEEACKEKIIERLTTTPIPKLAFFYMRKFVMQWNQGDFHGVFWAEKNVPEDEVIFPVQDSAIVIFQLIYVAILALAFIGVRNRKYIDDNKLCYLFYLILTGYGAAYLITETQGRYSYIASWVFIFLMLIGIKTLEEKKKLKVNHDKESI
ncbi:MAG: glycosyltransferase family 39 protein [Clostridium sp.]